MPVIDALANIGLPRYLSAEELLAVMDEYEVEAAIVSATPACADLSELSRAALRYGDRLHVVGEPMGKSAADRRDSLAAQLDAGFFGIHLADTSVAEEPELLEQIGAAGAVPFVTGSAGLSVAANALVAHLDRFPLSFVCAPAFGGVGDPDILDTDPAVRRLFGHPRFLVIFAGQGAYEPSVVRRWAARVVEITGWERALWGSDFPQCLWRGESYLSTTVWVDKAGLAPTASERDAFFGENARRLLAGRHGPRPMPLADPWRQPWEPDVALPVALFPNTPIDLPEDVQHVLLAAYFKRSGPGSYRDFIAEQLGIAARLMDSKGETR